MALPTTNLTLHVDASDTDTLFTTANGGGSGVHTGTPSDGSAVQIWDDEGDGSVADVALGHSTSTEPAWRSTTPLMLLPCLDFDGSTSRMVARTQDQTVGLSMSAVITDTSCTILVAFYAEAIPDTDSTIEVNPALLCDSGGQVGLHLRDESGVKKLYYFNYDGAAQYVPAAGYTISTGTSYVIMARHESGSIYTSLNGGSESSTVSGTNTDLDGIVRIGSNSNVTTWYNGRLGEIAIYNAALSGSNLSDAIAYFTDKWLATAVRPSRLTTTGAG